ncbi:hypothetical protein BGZ91_011163 [Linnemannia elongata]|nr:hypothetical protein BGZ91_011163 [Linnemannia elongata]
MAAQHLLEKVNFSINQPFDTKLTTTSPEPMHASPAENPSTRLSSGKMPNTLNLTVHVQIYYYMRSTAGVRIWWKQYLTTLEIV